MIRWILFDQARVQTHDVFSTKEEYRLEDRVFKAKVLEAIFYSRDYHLFEIGEIQEGEFIRSFLERESLDLTVSEYIALFKKGIEPIDGIEELLRSLHETFNLATLINESSSWAHYKLDVSGFRDFFKKVIISGDLGVAKPHKDFYLKSLELIDALPEECVFIDDKEENCNAARDLGITSILFKDPSQLKSELIKLKLLEP